MEAAFEYPAANIPDNALFDGRAVRRFLISAERREPAAIAPLRSVVYFLEGAGRVKIGWTSSLHSRLQALQAASPVPLRLLAIMRASQHMERELHVRFAEFRLHGEWFELAEPIRRFVAELRQEPVS